jgi:hypothetical protein
MVKLVIDEIKIHSDSETDIVDQENLANYKGYFHNEEESEEKYYEFGAHFPYKTLFSKLEKLKKSLSPSRIESTPKSKMN